MIDEAKLREVLAREPNVVLAYLFGSALRSESPRDVDIGVVLTTPADAPFDHRRLAGLALDLDEVVRPLAVDLKVLDDAPPFFRYQVVREGRCIFSRDEGKRIHFEALAAIDYLDIRDMLRMHDRFLIEHARAGRHGP